jgi:acyl carrier protein
MATRIEIKEKLGEIFKMASGDESFDLGKCDDSTNLVTDLGLNSVGILYVVIAIEEFFNIRFDDVGAADFVTVGDVINYIEKKVN